MNKRPHVLALGIFLFAFALGLSSINRGLQSDDYIHRHMLLDAETGFVDKVSHFYEFLGPTENIPWWTQEGLKISFYRPLSASTHWLDYQLWPDSSVLMHVHSVLWYAFLAILVLGFNRRLLETKLALLATLIFCLDFSHFSNLSWIANRNSLITACFILISFNNYFDWKKQQKKFSYLFSLFSFSLALFSAEAGIILLALIFLLECLILNKEKKVTLKTFLPLTPFFLVAGLWTLFYRLQGFGTANNSMYFSPTENVIDSFLLLFIKIPVFIFGNITSVEGFLNVFPQEIQFALSALCIVLLILMFLLVKKQIKESSTQFLLISTVLALIPVSFVAVTDMRLGLFSSVSSAALLAQVFFSLSQDHKKIHRSILAVLIFAHFIAAPLQWIYVGLRDFNSPPESFSQLRTLEQQAGEENIFVINYPSPIDGYYFPYTNNEKIFSHIFILNNNFSDYLVNAVSENEIRISSQSGLVFKNNDFSNLRLGEKPLKNGVYARSSFNGMLSKDYLFKMGDIFQTENFKVEILGNNEYGQITELRFTFSKALKENQLALWDNNERKFQPLSINKLIETPLAVKNF